MGTLKQKARIYVCHTYYHVYVAFLKEFALSGKTEKADIVLSSISTDFEKLGERLRRTGFFGEVIAFEEKKDTYFPGLARWKKDRGNSVLNLIQRMIFTKKFARLQEPFIPVDFSFYRDIYVFCDSDPVGYYLNYKKIPYHALEDGINCLQIFDAARYDNRGNFRLKAWMAAHNLIFIQNGYAKYCLDMEINQKEGLKYDCPKYVVVPRSELAECVGPRESEILLEAFIPDTAKLKEQLKMVREGQENVLLLTEQLCSLSVRKQIFTDILKEYCSDCVVFIKPHPRDEMDYEKEFPEQIVLKGRFPLEILNHIPQIHFHKAVSVFTQAVYSMDFVDEKVFLGEEFMDRYEDPDVHRYNDKI